MVSSGGDVKRVFFFSARKGESDGERNGGEADDGVLGQVHHRSSGEQIQLRRTVVPFKLRSPILGHEWPHHEALPEHAMKCVLFYKFEIQLFIVSHLKF